MKPRTVAIVQARMGSTRFPGKMLAALGDYPLLEWVLRRVAAAAEVDQVVLATSDLPGDQPLLAVAERCGVAVFRGSESDVLERFVGAARLTAAEQVVRVCADNPFIDPGEIDRLIRYFRDQPSDYACNHLDRLGSGYADGFGAEILAAGLLYRMADAAREPRHREHVTLYLWDHAADFRLAAVPAPDALAFPHLRFDVDRPADLEGLKRLQQSAGLDMGSPAADIVHEALAAEFGTYLERLFPICRSLTGAGNRETLRILNEIVPIEQCEVPSGSAVYDWTVPDEWNIRGAWIADASGRRLIDFAWNNLHVVSYSEPVRRRMDWQELQPHLHTHPDLPEAIPYRTSYYRRDWGFCLTHAQYAEMEGAPGPFEVVIDSELRPGSLTYGECLLPGRSSREILLSCYICHPSMANDSLSGVLVTAFLARYLASRPDRQWSYRVVFVPETIGAVAYCARNEAAMQAIDLGLVITTTGGPGPFGYKRSWQAEHPINRLIEECLAEMGKEYRTYPFDIHGSDERQYSSQGFGINVATISKDRYYEYPQYHSSLDDLSFVTGSQLAESFAVYRRLIAKLEARRIYRNRVPHGEVMLSRHGLYPTGGGALRPELGGRTELDLILWLLFLCDGRRSLEDIGHQLGVDPLELRRIAENLESKAVLEHV